MKYLSTVYAFLFSEIDTFISIYLPCVSVAITMIACGWRYVLNIGVTKLGIAFLPAHFL